jgi:4-hydroxy-4-methyl-2-oxoglutarate aldolase
MTGKARLTSEQLEALRLIDSPSIAKAIETFGVRPHTTGFMGMDIKCLMPELGVMVGYAVTVTADSQTEDLPFDSNVWWDILNAVNDSPKPAVLVFQDVGPRPTHACFFGDGMATLTHRLGATGLVTNGGVRDLPGVRRLGFHFFATGLTVSHGNLRLVSSGEPVEISGIRVEPGDLIHADENGVVLIPAEVADRVAVAARQVHDEEAEARAYSQSEDFSLAEIGRRLGVTN